MTARLYVGTYAKYNAGDLTGAWLDLEDYSDREAFLEACAELHKDEEDPELMFQDYESFPSEWYAESSAPPQALWDWLDLSDWDKELLAAYLEHGNQDGDIKEAREAFQGKGSSRADCAESWYEEVGYEVPDWLQCHVDWDSLARDMQCGDFYFAEHEGETWMFRR